MEKIKQIKGKTEKKNEEEGEKANLEKVNIGNENKV